MCGLAGYLNLANQHEPISEKLLSDMQAVLLHRGPDAMGIWKSDHSQIGFAFRRLSIIDLSPLGNQPMVNDSVAICFNGEIYNYQKLHKELERLGYHFISNSDTEVLLHGYTAWGIALLDKLDGFFAIALFDKKTEELFLIRDRMGVKPLYFSPQGGFLSFASEIKALWQLPWNKKEISSQAFYHYLSFMVTPAPYTMFSNVYKLPAGFYAKVDKAKNLSFHEWYSPIKPISSIEQQAMNDEHYVIEKTRYLLTESTKKRMICDVPFGAFLSGGIDSSLNVALMAQEIGKVKTFTVAFSDEPDNELAWARKVAKLFDTDHHEIIISEKEAFEFYHKMLYHLDEPLADPVCIPFYYVSKLARDSGVTVVQVGEGADELFFGYNIYAQYLNTYKKFWRPTTHIPTVAKKLLFRAAKKFAPQKSSVTDIFYKWQTHQNLFWGGAIAFSEPQKEFFLRHNNFNLPALTPDSIAQQMYQGLGEAYDSHNIIEYHLSELQTKDPHASFIKQMTYLELKQRLPELLLMRADKMSMATSIEAREPYLDYKLVEFALNIPDHLKFKNNTTKYILKKVCEGILPSEIIYRKKVGFAAPITRWLSHEGLFANYFKQNNVVINENNDNPYNIAIQKWIIQMHKNF